MSTAANAQPESGLDKPIPFTLTPLAQAYLTGQAMADKIRNGAADKRQREYLQATALPRS